MGLIAGILGRGGGGGGAGGSGDFKADGSVDMTGAFGTDVGTLRSDVADGASAVGFDFDTANAFTTAGAKLASWKNDGVEKAYIDKDGAINLVSNATIGTTVNTIVGSGFQFQNGAIRQYFKTTLGVYSTVSDTTAGEFSFVSQMRLSWTDSNSNAISGAEDVILRRDAAANLAQRNGANAQTFRVYNTFTDASNYERLAITGSAITVETAGTGTDDIDLTLAPAGAGRVKFGTHSGLSGESVSGYIEIKDAGGTTRKLAVVS